MEKRGKNRRVAFPEKVPIDPHPNLQPSRKTNYQVLEKLSYLYIDGMEFISVSVYFCKITTGGLNRNMRTVYGANDAGELTICIKFCLVV